MTTDPQPDRPKKRVSPCSLPARFSLTPPALHQQSRPTRAHPSSPRVCTTCARTDSPEWRRGPHGPKTLCNACGLKWAKASGAGRRRGGQANTNEWRGEAFSSNVQSPASRPGTADPFQGPPPTSAPLASSTSLPVSTNLPSSLAPPPSSSLPSSLVGSSAPVIAVPPNPRSPVGSHSPDVKVETDAPSGLMDLATVAALESGRTDEPQSQSLKRPRADSSYNGLGRYDRPPSSRTPSSTRGYPEPYTPAYPDKPYSESATRPYSDSSRTYSSSGSEGAGGVRPINVIPIGSYRLPMITRPRGHHSPQHFAGDVAGLNLRLPPDSFAPAPRFVHLGDRTFYSRRLPLMSNNAMGSISIYLLHYIRNNRSRTISIHTSRALRGITVVEHGNLRFGSRPITPSIDFLYSSVAYRSISVSHDVGCARFFSFDIRFGWHECVN
ncbi:GATA domain-containing protein [Rhizoctonia solani AG-1 IA]|uniref:GATA domain-containing protein n=1 Tax=Thanatephorus cucumeris (strain AG1-IA) TaxID=983506 RepID=L8WKY4_THACA|nr:GATA domain-containing protein [Rhizoctonia solani AG-1 IA]